MTATAIILFLLGLAAGAAAGWFFSRQQAEQREKARVEALELTLADCRREMEQYRAEVGRHFETTAGLFTEVTAAYRELHHHLADGYEKLAGAPKGKMLLDNEGGMATRTGQKAAAAAIAAPLAYGADMQLDETAGDEGDLDEAARRELDRNTTDDEGLPESMGSESVDDEPTHGDVAAAQTVEEAEQSLGTQQAPQFARSGELDEDVELDDPIEFGKVAGSPMPKDGERGA